MRHPSLDRGRQPPSLASGAQDAESAGGEEYESGRFGCARRCGLGGDGEGVATDVEGSGEEGGVGSGSGVEQISMIRDRGGAAWVVDHDLEASARECGIEEDLAAKRRIPEECGIEGQGNGEGFEQDWIAGTEDRWRCG